MRKLVLLLVCLSCGPQAYASRLVGQADFSFLWFDVYQASLYHPQGHFNFEQLVGTRLELNYKVNLKSNELVKGTKKQWQELGFEIDQQREGWLQQLGVIWPNIEDGDSLAFSVLPSGAGEFALSRQGGEYKTIGVIDSAIFSEEFLAIWLADRNDHKEFRLALLGHKE